MWAKRNKQTAFTIVELLIVVVVIAILATITIISYNGIQERARESAASSALSQASKKIAIAMNDGTLTGYPVNQAAFDALGIPTSSASYQYKPVPLTNPTGYCITATVGTTSYNITQSSQPTKGACAGHGSGGVAAITNLSTNPSFESGVPSGSIYNATATIVTDQGVTSETSALRLHSTRTSNGEAMRFVQGGFGALGGLSAGTTYTLSADMTVLGAFAVTQSEQRQICLRWNPGTRICSPQAPNSAGTTRLSVTAQIPAGVEGIMVQLNHYGTSTDPDVIIDSIMITEGSNTYNYADGNSAGWEWNGAQNNSSSTGSPL